MIDATGHDRFATQDYARLAAAGMQTARDGLRWHRIEERPGVYEFGSLERQVRAARAAGVQVVWDLLHYGTPDHVDLFAPDFPDVFARFARAAALALAPETEGPLWLCPVNEISFLSWGGGEVGYLNPFVRGQGGVLKAQLVRAVIRAMDAVREVCPQARFLHAEPLLNIMAHPGQPTEAEAARREHEAQFEALDMLAGRLRPELGGAERYLDVIGLNFYPYNQWWHHDQPESRELVPYGHPAYRPLRDLLAAVHARYGRPLLLAETGTEDEERPAWFRMVARETLAAQAASVPVHGVCLYPVVNHPGWDDDRHCHNGLWDYPDVRGHREVYRPLLEEVQAARALLERLEPGQPLPGATAPIPVSSIL
ncbi:beta-glucosidase [Deinococcus metallilatus]|uniref:Beta-glucosidase n=1 Tax=Deinococcus metallilatus TaxID=1211322 RepID=A0ABR6MZA8_9DEIO|nr:beta-glucosidase [Deinococcus metallilatus]MBB5297283.1 hypothetical protein [Deinococcus metallilatus]